MFLKAEPVIRVVSSVWGSVSESAWLKWCSNGPPEEGRMILKVWPASKRYSGGREKRKLTVSGARRIFSRNLPVKVMAFTNEDLRSDESGGARPHDRIAALCRRKERRAT